MQFTRPFKELIRAGSVTRSYRTWKKPQAKPGGRYNLHPYGAIEVTDICVKPIARLKKADVRPTGFDSVEALTDFLKAGPEDNVYQVDFRYLGAELINQPDTSPAPNADIQSTLGKLDAMDRRAEAPWTIDVLNLIAEHPGRRAADLATMMGWQTLQFKTRVRRLKSHGLTISLETGYRLSPKGEQCLEN